jgi:hypothetical protein
VFGLSGATRKLERVYATDKIMKPVTEWQLHTKVVFEEDKYGSTTVFFELN